MVKRRIVNCNYGIASSYDDCIEMNVKLLKYPKLRKKILKHEKAHTLGKYSKKDYQVDFQAEKPHFFEALWFSIRNPEALINYMPFMYSYYHKKWTFNSTGIFPIFLFGVIFWIFWSILLIPLSFSFIHILLESFILWIEICTLINIILLIYTDFYVRNVH